MSLLKTSRVWEFKFSFLNGFDSRCLRHHVNAYQVATFHVVCFDAHHKYFQHKPRIQQPAAPSLSYPNASVRPFSSTRLAHSNQGKKDNSQKNIRLQAMQSQDDVDSEIYFPSTPSSTTEESFSTNLIKEIQNLIKFNGPISVSQYMRMALTHPKHGYYIQKPVFGKKGDYTTSPEISQLFGEMVAIWWIYLWQAINKNLKEAHSGFQLIELGPGRGTLLNDIWRSFANFKDVTSQCRSIVMIEASSSLREVQLQTVCPDAIDIERDARGQLLRAKMRGANIPLIWLESISEWDPSHFSFLIAHEFFDTLPIFKFKYTEHGWREIMIDLDDTPNAKHPFRYALSPRATQASQSLPSFTTSTRPQIGDVIEVSPESQYYAQSIGTLLQRVGGAGLIMDYGEVGPSNASLRAIRDHKFVDLFESPGTCDLSANVDFALLNVAFRSTGLRTHPVLTQSQFLHACGIHERLRLLLHQHPSMEKDLMAGYTRLTQTMGTIYKCCTVTSRVDEVLGFSTRPSIS